MARELRDRARTSAANRAEHLRQGDRSGTVLRVRNVSSRGDACYDGGGSACATLANTVEVKHSDGTVALYMHLNRGTVRVGDTVSQGDEIGKSDSSGWSTSPHFHIRVHRDCGI